MAALCFLMARLTGLLRFMEELENVIRFLLMLMRPCGCCSGSGTGRLGWRHHYTRRPKLLLSGKTKSWCLPRMSSISLKKLKTDGTLSRGPVFVLNFCIPVHKSEKWLLSFSDVSFHRFFLLDLADFSFELTSFKVFGRPLSSVSRYWRIRSMKNRVWSLCHMYTINTQLN